MVQNDPNGAQAVMRAIDVLDCFVDAAGGELSASEISAKVDLTMSTTHRLVKALAHRGLVSMDAVSKRYSLGPAVMRYSSVVLRRSQDVVAIVMPLMRQLRESTGETVGLHWRLGHERLCVAELVSPQPLRMESGVGISYPLVAGSAGKAILAHLTEADRDEVLRSAASTASARKKMAALRSSLDDIRKTGVAVSRGETTPGAFGIAVPVADAYGTVIGSINVTGPEVRLTDKIQAWITKTLLTEVARLAPVK